MLNQLLSVILDDGVSHLHSPLACFCQMNNYALNLQLWKGRNRRSMPGHFHPDVF
jgi:hypothetical protein